MTGLQQVHFFRKSELLDGSESDGTNLVTGGNGMTSGWAVVSATLTAAAATASDGTTTASSLLESAANSRHIAYQIVTTGAGSTRTLSIYAKSITRQYLQLMAQASATATQVYGYFDLTSGLVTDSGIISSVAGSSVSSAAIQAAANGYYKCSYTFKIDNATTTDVYFIIATSDVGTFGAPLDQNSPSFTGNTSDGAYLWRPKIA